MLPGFGIVKLKKVTLGVDMEEEYITVNEDTGYVDVKPIDRDKYDLTLYKFKIEACVCKLKRDWCTEDEVTFIIDDIDNNAPLITENDYKNGTNETFLPDEEKIIQLSYLENYSESYNFSTNITDIDTGVNAQFNVYLEKYGNKNDIDYTEAYMIVPTVGYRTGLFQITVKNNTNLDFENEKWKNHKYYVVSKGVLNPKKMNDRMLISVSLIDYNDESPEFDKTSYTTSMNETVNGGYEVLTAHATDLDAEDKILKMDISGSYASERLAIDSKGKITVKNDGTFDYDILRSVYFQVTATDKANHVTSVPVTITINDVNNKAPVIAPVTRVIVEENQPNGTPLNLSLTASDVDTTADLTAYIDWDTTTITKTNSIVDITPEVEEAIHFLEIENKQTNGGRGLEIELRVINNNDDNPDKPDFELFDTLNLAITIEDLNTDPAFEDKRTTTGIIVISIKNINDNPPTFPDSNNVERSADEAASKGASVGFVKATDVDTPDSDITYYCIAEDEKFDWIEVNETSGALSVKNEGEINADIPIYYFNYTCWAYDGLFFSQPLNVSIYVVDTNNKLPVIGKIGEITVEEQSPPGHNVYHISTSDKDRDVPFHTVNCSFLSGDVSSSEGGATECAEQFNFDKENNILVTNGYDKLNRDRGPALYNCIIGCKDNILNERSQGSHTTNKSITITLKDINNNAPELKTFELISSENLNESQEIGIIYGEDIDEGKNAEIEFTILSAIYDADGKDHQHLFEIARNDDEGDYVVNVTYKKVHLIANENLTNYYGTFDMTLFLTDKGDEPLNSTGSINLTINKFNFFSPEIMFPVNGQNITLLSVQTPGKPLTMYEENKKLQNFYATDGVSEKCPKWDVIFDLQQEDDEIFVLHKDAKCQSQLQINDNFSKVVLNHPYDLTITASVKKGEEEKGEAPYSSSVGIKVFFLDINQQPKFNVKTWNLSFVEANTTQKEQLQNKAHYQGVTLPVYYSLLSDNTTLKKLFKVDENTGDLAVVGNFYYDFDKTFEFSIGASNGSNGVDTDIDEDSVLNVTVTVLSSNRRSPTWIKAPYFGAIMPDYIVGSPVITAQAHDDDEIDQGNLECYISSKFIIEGTGLDNVGNEPFKIESRNDAGKIFLNFRVETSMSGLFAFNITVKDRPDEYGHESHENTTTVTIFIITSDNTVDFRFYNEKEEVYNKETEMLQIITEVVGYRAYTQNIDSKKSDGTTITTARLYFIENKKDGFNLINKKTILGIVGNVNTYTKLASRLRKEQQLLLSNFESTNTNTSNSEAVLKAWLIGVAVVLGTLVIILLITLILKIRQLNRRISKLTTSKFGSQESGLNRIGVNAPTTNKHAIEGSNPIYKSDRINNVSDLDNRSVRSGDSELIGVEDNPEFDLPEQSAYF